MTFASALSRHPDSAVAVGEVVGSVLEAVGPAPDLAVMFFTGAHLPHAEAAAATVQTLLDPATFVGASAAAVLAGHEGVENQPGVALWAARWGDHLAEYLPPVHLSALPVGASREAWTFSGLDDAIAASARTLVLMADPFTFPVDDFLVAVRRQHPHLAIIGGLASAGRQAGGNRLVIGGRVARHGAVGVLLPPGIAPRTVVSQGCRPVGQPFTVTRSDGNLLHELGGRPALSRVAEMLQGLDEEDRLLASRGLHCGIVADESKVDFERGDFLIRGVLGADRATQSVVVGDEVPVGATVQFQVRDAATASEDLRVLLAGQEAAAALVFTCNGRGAGMFGDPHHDAAIVHEHVGAAVAGMFCAGEIGPVGPRNALHGFTASVALFQG
jgi:small ligand-binding sensory domain FIST